MKKITRLSQSGFSIVEFLLLAVVVGIIGFVGFRMKSMHQSAAPSVTSSSNAIPATITSTAELTTTSKAMDRVDVDSSLDTSALDADLNSLL